MPIEFQKIHQTQFPQNPLTPNGLYEALYASRVTVGAHQPGMFPGMEKSYLEVTDHCNLYSGSIQRRNTEYMEVYFCGPLTSAGAIRSPDKSGNTFRRNVIVAETYRDALLMQLAEESQDLRLHLTVPGHIGVRDNFRFGTGWGEGQYNLFWLYYLSGIDPVSANRFGSSESTQKNIQAINNKQKKREEYRPAYQNMVDEFIRFVNNPNNGARLNKMSKIIALPDYKFSFGSQMEIRLAKGIGIPVEEVSAHTEWLAQQKHLWFNHQSKGEIGLLDGEQLYLPTHLEPEELRLNSI